MVCIIAEVGVNHNGDMNQAKKLIDVAFKAGCDAVKFQAWKAGNLVTNTAPMARYQIANTGKEGTQFEMLKKLELSCENQKELKKYCKNLGFDYICSPFDMEGVKEMKQLKQEVVKVASGEITNTPLLREIGTGDWEIIMSTGMADNEEIRYAIEVINSKRISKKEITLLHCTTEYPAPVEELNLKCIETMKNRFRVNVGYSDHSKGIHIPLAAVAMGATIIEKHITLDNNMEGPDHRASIEPNQLMEMVSQIRDIEKSIGNGIKKTGIAESKNKDIARKSIVTKEKIKAGELFTEVNLTTKRPGFGVSAIYWDQILGTITKRNYDENELIEMP